MSTTWMCNGLMAAWVLFSALISLVILGGEAASMGLSTEQSTDTPADTITSDLPWTLDPLGDMTEQPGMQLPVDSQTDPMTPASVSPENVKSRNSESAANFGRPHSPPDKRLSKLLEEITKIDLKKIFALSDDDDDEILLAEDDYSLDDLINFATDIVKWDLITSQEIVGIAREFVEDRLKNFLEVTNEDSSAIAKGGEMLVLQALDILPESLKEGVYLFSHAVEVDAEPLAGPGARSSPTEQKKKIVNPALAVSCPHKLSELAYCWIYDIFDMGTELTSQYIDYMDFGSYVPSSLYRFIPSDL